MPRPQLAKSLIPIHQFAALRLSKSMLHLSRNVHPMLSNPLLLLMEHLHRPSHKLIRRPIRPPLHILLDQRLQLRIEMNRHTCKLAENPSATGQVISATGLADINQLAQLSTGARYPAAHANIRGTVIGVATWT